MTPVNLIDDRIIYHLSDTDDCILETSVYLKIYVLLLRIIHK